MKVKIIEGYDCLAEIQKNREKAMELYYKDPAAFYEDIRQASMRVLKRMEQIDPDSVQF